MLFILYIKHFHLSIMRQNWPIFSMPRVVIVKQWVGNLKNWVLSTKTGQKPPKNAEKRVPKNSDSFWKFTDLVWKFPDFQTQSESR